MSGVSSGEAIILDVGHGNATVFLDDSRAIVVDAGSEDLVTRTLADHGVTEIAALVVSHSHRDHTSEVPTLLSNPELCVRKLFINADSTRAPETSFERFLRAGFRDSHDRHGTELQQLNETLSRQLETDGLVVEVLWPDSDLAFGGIGSETKDGVEVDAHNMAAVLRVGLQDGRSILLCADLAHEQFVEMLAKPGIDLRATVLVYPHHGGLSGAADEEAFARELTAAVDPEIVVFSHGRSRHQNPRPEVVRGVRSARLKPPIRVLCTQLSTNCSAEPLDADGRLDPSVRHRGANDGSSCSGSLRLPLDPAIPLLARGAQHLAFVLSRVDGNLCLAAQGAAEEA
jgi:competence protein ComEC